MCSHIGQIRANGERLAQTGVHLIHRLRFASSGTDICDFGKCRTRAFTEFRPVRAGEPAAVSKAGLAGHRRHTGRRWLGGNQRHMGSMQPKLADEVVRGGVERTTEGKLQTTRRDIGSRSDRRHGEVLGEVIVDETDRQSHRLRQVSGVVMELMHVRPSRGERRRMPAIVRPRTALVPKIRGR